MSAINNSEPRFKLTDIAALVSLLVSIISFTVNWSTQNELEQKQQADTIRKAAAAALAKVERRNELSIALFSEIQPIFVETSIRLIVDEQYQYEPARDYLYTQLILARSKITEQIVREDIETAYANLYGFEPATYLLFTSVIQKTKQDEDIVFDRLLSKTEEDLFSIRIAPEQYQTAMLGNKLRKTADSEKNALEKNNITNLQCLRRFLADIITMNDSDVVNKRFSTYTCQ